MKKRIIVLFLTLIVFASMQATAETTKPHYEIFLKLYNHNIPVDEGTNLDVDIMGSGRCDEGNLILGSETPFTIREKKMFNAHSLYSSDSKETGTEFENYCRNWNCNFSSPGQTLNMDTVFDKSLFSSEESRFNIGLNVVPNTDYLNAGGEYSLRAYFFCKKDNETFVFKDATWFRVMYEGESKQYTTTYVLAIIAVIISFFALIVTVTKEFLIPLFFKPKLEITGKNKPFYIEDGQNLGRHRYLRLKIENLNSRWSLNAKNCCVKLVEVKKGDKLMQPFTPAPLKWSIYDEENGIIMTRKHDLAKGELHFVDLCHEDDHGKRILRFQTPINPLLLETFDPGKYTFKIGIFGDNFEPKFETFEVKFTDKYGELKFL